MQLKKEKIAFIVNPISGSGKNQNFEKHIEKYLDLDKFEADVIYTKMAGQAPKIAKEQIEKKVGFIIAVGGDGTINEVAGALAHTDAVFGIIPRGSGNGLARHLGISLKLPKAFDIINKKEIQVIDYGKVNEKPFFCTSGVGFDALIGWEFAHAGTRGFFTYFKKTIKEFFGYEPQRYQIRTNGHTYERTAFLVAFANASQYGGSAFIAPKASVKDGMLDIIIFKPFPLFAAFSLVAKLFSGKMDTSKYVEVIKAENCYLEREGEGHIHLDGEPQRLGTKINVETFKEALRVLTPKKEI